MPTLYPLGIPFCGTLGIVVVVFRCFTGRIHYSICFTNNSDLIKGEKWSSRIHIANLSLFGIKGVVVVIRRALDGSKVGNFSNFGQIS